MMTTAGQSFTPFSSPAELFAVEQNGRVRCRLCRHACLLADGQHGLCGVRLAEHGTLRTLVGRGVAACHPDPVEKKPLYHYLPGSRTLSIGTMGCNFDCAWCQNASLSRTPAETGIVRFQSASPADLVRLAQETDCASVAFTYNEPTVFFELMIHTADAARQENLGTILVSNGYQSASCLTEIERRIHAANIDLKAFRESTYRRYCRAHLAPVLDNLKTMRAFGWWLEVTTLVIPGVNDELSELRDMARFMVRELGPETPWHLSAFHPCRAMSDRPPTPSALLLRAADAAREEGLLFVYPGNLPPEHERPTRCPICDETLIRRQRFRSCITRNFDGRCPRCGQSIPGVWAPFPSRS